MVPAVVEEFLVQFVWFQNQCLKVHRLLNPQTLIVLHCIFWKEQDLVGVLF